MSYNIFNELKSTNILVYFIITYISHYISVYINIYISEIYYITLYHKMS